MSNKLKQILIEAERQKFATDTGKKMHAKMQKININNGDEIKKILNDNKELSLFFNVNSKTEVPVAGYINGRFVSRRIDRLTVDEKAKKVYILDYKTDTDKSAFKEKYINQIKEYVALLQDVYSGYEISGFILWLNDFSLEKIL